jgi:hypothetical protein
MSPRNDLDGLGWGDRYAAKETSCDRPARIQPVHNFARSIASRSLCWRDQPEGWQRMASETRRSKFFRRPRIHVPRLGAGPLDEIAHASIQRTECERRSCERPVHVDEHPAISDSRDCCGVWPRSSGGRRGKSNTQCWGVEEAYRTVPKLADEEGNSSSAPIEIIEGGR